MAGQMLPKQTIHKAAASLVAGILGIAAYFGFVPDADVADPGTIIMVVTNIIASCAVYFKKNYQAD